MAVEIGKVSVRVMPDTRGFASKARRDLKKLNDLTFKVNVELNEKHFRAKVNQLVAKTNVDLMKPSNRIKFHASLEASDRQLSAEVRDIRNRMQEMANEEKVTIEAGLSKATRRKVGPGGILGINPEKTVRDFKRQLKSERYELPVYAQTSQAMKDIRRMKRSSRFGIKVDLNVDRKAIHEDVESVKALMEKTAKSLGQAKGLKFAIDVDKASIRKWKASLRETTTELKAQQDLYKETQHQLQIVKDRAAAYGKTVSEATKRITKLNAQQANDLKREQKLVEELGDIREIIAKTAGDTTEEAIREKRIVGQIEELRRNAYARSAERTEAEAKAVAEIRDAQRQITRLKREQKRLSEDAIKNAGKLESLAVDEKKLQEDLDRARNKLEMDAIELDVALDEFSFEAVAARLRELARDRLVTVWTRVQRANFAMIERQWRGIAKHTGEAAGNAAKWMGQLTGVRVLWRTFKDMVEILPRLDMMVPQLAQNLALITAGTAGAIGGVGTLFTLLSDIGEVGKLIIGLPAGIFGVAGSALILGRALHDFKEVFPEIISYYEQLGEVVSDSVWKQAAGPIRELHKSLKPLLDAHVPDWASAWGSSLGALADGLGSTNALGNLEIFLKNSILGTKNAEKGWESLGSAIMSMVGGGSDVFPDLGTWFSETMADFDTWAKNNQAVMGEWLREGGTALRELGSIGVSTVKIVAGIADAFDKAGWPGLTELEQGMKSLGESALGLKDSSGFMFTLYEIRDFFAELKTLAPQAELALQNAWTMIGRTIGSLSSPITGALGGILDGFNSSKFQSGFRTFVDGLGSFIEDITPGLEAMTAEIGSLLGVVGTAGESWGPAFNDMLLLFASAGDKLHPGLIDFVENTGPALQDLVKDITPHVEDFAEAISDLLGNEGFQDLVGDLIGDLGTLGGIILDLGTWVAETAEKFSDWYDGLSDGQQDFVRWGAIITAALGGVGLAISKALLGVGKFVLTLPGVLPAITKAFKKVFKPRALVKALRPILARFAGILTGPVGWALLIASIIKPVDLANLADWIVDALGLENTWLGRLTEQLKTSVEEFFGDMSLLDMLIKPFKAAWDDFTSGDWKNGLARIFTLNTPELLIVVLEAIAAAFGWEKGLEEVEAMKRILDEDGVAGLFKATTDGILAALSDGWSALVDAVTSWKPVAAVIDFFQDPWGKIKGWLFGEEPDITAGIDTHAVQADLDYSEGLRTDILNGLQNAWDKLIGFIREWNPFSLGFKFGEWVGDKIKEWLGIDEGGGIDTSGFSLDFDFSSLWENKIKPALKNGLLALVALITAPGLVLLAPLALPALIVGWLLGRDEEGNWSFEELKNKVTGTWENIKTKFTEGVENLKGKISDLKMKALNFAKKIIEWLIGKASDLLGSFDEIRSRIEGAWGEIKSAITGGVAAIGGLIGGLVIAPIAVGKKMVEWLLGNDWVQKAKSSIESSLSGAAETIGGAVKTGTGVIRSAAQSAGRAGAKVGSKIGGIMPGILGVDAAGQAQTQAGFGNMGDLIGRFTSFASDRYGSMSTSTGSHLGDMGGAARRSFGQISDTAIGKTDGMRRTVVSKMDAMKVGAGAKTAAMKAAVIAKMGAMKASAGVKMAAMQAAVIAKMGAMQVGAAAKMVAMQTLISAAMISLQLKVVAAASRMGVAYVAQMTSMMARSVAVAMRIRSALMRALRINLSGAGRSTGASFVSGLASGLYRAVRVAYSMRSSIRSALSFSAYRSGSAVGGTFASGLRARVRSVVSAGHSLAAAARRALPNSPAEEGPFSGSGWGGWGESIAEELAKGLRKSAPEVAREAERLMGGVHSAIDARSDARVGVNFERTRRKHGLASDEESAANAGTNVNVNVESRSEDPLQDGNRFGGDIAFALRGAGLA